MSDTREKNSFQFGIESEFIVTDTSDAPLWYRDLNFADLNETLESISLDGVPSLQGLELESPHQKRMPYVVEGYHLPHQNDEARTLLPKGLEIRTPVCESIDQLMGTFELLYVRLEEALRPEGKRLFSLSHHPCADSFSGPINKRRHDFWVWAMQAMTTYGPDINIGLPFEMWKHRDWKDFERKVNFYGAAMALGTLASPISKGRVWRPTSLPGRSLRTYRRSVVAPSIELHPDENQRIEFKLFDMPTSIEEYRAQVLMVVALVLSDRLVGRAERADLIYELGDISRYGFGIERVRRKLGFFLEESTRTLHEWGFDAGGLKPYMDRFDQQKTPADKMLEEFARGDDSIDLARLVQSRPGLKIKSTDSFEYGALSF